MVQCKSRPALQRHTWASRLYEWNLAVVTDRLDVVRVSERARSKNCSDTFGENLQQR